MLRFLMLLFLGFIMVRLIRNFFLGPPSKSRVKESPQKKEEDFQQKYKNKIEDADFEELE